ncbi:MAG: hypothetical protein HY564_02060 [Candidatus Jacksonbacteria bacterium]|nr:hypothetical protein [Candidatus Jacksonbacteria bacterium]
MKKYIVRQLTKRYDRTLARVKRMEADLRTEKHKEPGFAFRLLRARVKENLLEFLIIVVSDPSESFIVLKKRDEFAVCSVSYVEYRLYSRKMKLLSLGGMSSVLFATLMVSFIVNFIMPNFQALAATFTWNQTNWNGGTDGGSYPTHADNRTNWTKYSSKNITVDASQNGVLTTTDSVVIVGQTDADFNAGTVGSFTEVVTGQNKVRLKIAQ